MLQTIKQTILRGIDPHLGHTYLSPQDIGLVEGEELCAGHIRIGPDDPQRTRIAILGGSTSDLSYNGSWLRPFYNICCKNGHSITIYSAAVSGYSSSQEIFKLIRDILPIQPKLVISLNGVNDLGFIQSISPEHPMVHHYQSKIFNHLAKMTGSGGFFRNFGNSKLTAPRAMNDTYAIGGINYGGQNCLSAARFWERNACIMRAISNEFGASYRCFLQPIAGVGKYNLSNDEVESLEVYNINKKLHGEGYKIALEKFYLDARLILQKHTDFMVDLVDIYEGYSEMYADIRHPNKPGNLIIAQHIYQNCCKLI